jgi:hypothetical protein
LFGWNALAAFDLLETVPHPGDKLDLPRDVMEGGIFGQLLITSMAISRLLIMRLSQIRTAMARGPQYEVPPALGGELHRRRRGNSRIAYDDSRKGFKLTDATFMLPPVRGRVCSLPKRWPPIAASNASFSRKRSEPHAKREAGARPKAHVGPKSGLALAMLNRL